MVSLNKINSKQEEVKNTKIAMVSVEYSARRGSSEVKKYVLDMKYAKEIMKRYGNNYT